MRVLRFAMCINLAGYQVFGLRRQKALKQRADERGLFDPVIERT